MPFDKDFKQFIYSVNPWWSSSNYSFDVIDRESYIKKILNHNNKLIQILIGARRVGKTSIIHSTINNLLKRVDKRKILYIPADLRDIQEMGIKKTLEYYAKEHKLNIFKEKLHVFIDEVQELDGWQKEVKLLYDNTNIHFYLTGSSSLILRQDTSKLTGRFILHHVLPLSFDEFKLFVKKDTDEKLLNLYLEIGGYPEYVQNRNKVYLKQAIESTLYRELLDYYGIRSPKILNDILELLADKITSPVSASRISKDLKIDDKTANFYLDYLKSVYLIYPVYQYKRSHKLSKNSIPKYYLNDTGVLNLMGIRTRIGHVVENAVFLHFLRQQSEQEYHSIYYDVIDEQEIDFRIKDDLYEVKGHNDLDTEELKRYELEDNMINLIYKTEKGIKKPNIHIPNLKLIQLQSLLIED